MSSYVFERRRLLKTGVLSFGKNEQARFGVTVELNGIPISANYSLFRIDEI
ncbi:hypothetical protein [Nitrosospira sp. Nsp14]|uniref:hypothetical protein n=1 Tax=Nitrosospira sp. Nsp14 TaxID=1855333 RepID=UPI0015A5DBA1|nr:hypothetical protein [Nitrosospira sp. Nsp14]